MTESRAELRELLREWSKAAAEMTAGEMIGDVNDEQLAPPDDTGETVGLPPSGLTITFGFGPSLFDAPRARPGRQAAGGAARIPPLPGDERSTLESGGDLCVQACADDPQVVFHAIRNLARIGRGTVVMRWSQLGFGRTSSTSRSQETPRNLMGFKDGTANIRAEDAEAMDRFVWVGGDGPAWMRGGSYLVTPPDPHAARGLGPLLARRPGADDRPPASTAARRSARATSSTRSTSTPRGDGEPVIPVDAHVRLASATVNDGERILRRGYSFTDGVDESLGELEAGLFFIAFQRDPEKQFVAIQRRLGSSDALNEYIKHVGSADLRRPPGARPGGYVGETLLG